MRKAVTGWESSRVKAGRLRAGSGDGERGGVVLPTLRKPGQAVMVSREQPSAAVFGVSQFGRAMTPG